jgi:hypothetical protein
MSHPNLALVQSVYGRSRRGIGTRSSPPSTRTSAGTIPATTRRPETLLGVEAIMGYLMGDNHMDD